MSAAKAQAQAQIEVARLHCILRPDETGRWRIQGLDDGDPDHAPIGCTRLTQLPDALVLDFDRRYTHAGVIQITSDDDFGQRVAGYGNLGLTGSRIVIYACGQQIDPGRVRECLPGGSGNLWVSVTMVNRP